MAEGYSSFFESIQAAKLGISLQQEDSAAHFAFILHRENEKQNLTRIVGASEFVEGHLLDVVALLSLPSLGKRVLDVGSGSGVPGLLAAAIDLQDDRDWILTESERSKAEYLETARTEMGLEKVKVLHSRAEDVIKSCNPDTVIARAVGTVDKIAGWLWACSTWNNLILFKSKGWEKEWEEARLTKFGKKLTISHTHDYSSNGKTRVLVTLKRK